MANQEELQQNALQLEASDGLTEIEIQQVQTDVEMLNNWWGRPFDERQEALNRIASLGNKVLPHIEQEMLLKDYEEGSCFNYASLLEQMVGTENIDFIFRAIKNPKIFAYSDGSAISTLLRKIKDLVPQLDEETKVTASTNLIELLKKEDEWGNRYSYQDCQRTLERIDTEIGKKFLLESNYNNKVPVLNSSETFGDKDDFGTGEDDDFGDLLKDYSEQFYGKKENQSLINKTKEVLSERRTINPTAYPAVAFHMFHFLGQYPEASLKDINKELDKYESLSRSEELYSLVSNPLPTIGIELEIPDVHIPNDKKYAMRELGIPNIPEVSDNLYEIYPNFSYSPWVQARIIQELISHDMLPTKKVNGKKVIESKDLSMHINFAIPAVSSRRVEFGRTPKEQYRTNIQRIVDILTYAFVSVERVLNRKTSDSYFFKSGPEKSKKNKKVSNNELSEDTVRFEIRPTGFKDKSSFRLLAESQVVCALFVAHIRQKEGEMLTDIESELAGLYQEFDAKTVDLLAKYEVAPLLSDLNPNEAASLYDNKEFIEECRSVVSKYSRLGAQVIEGKMATYRSRLVA